MKRIRCDDRDCMRRQLSVIIFREGYIISEYFLLEVTSFLNLQGLNNQVWLTTHTQQLLLSMIMNRSKGNRKSVV